jgi:hypothetical protein
MRAEKILNSANRRGQVDLIDERPGKLDTVAA